MTSKSEKVFPDIPSSCYPFCRVCSDDDGTTKVVDRCYLRRPRRNWRDQDIVQVVVFCHDEETTALITNEELRAMSADTKLAENFVKLLCDMSSFKSGKDLQQRNRVVKSLKRKGAPWNF